MRITIETDAIEQCHIDHLIGLVAAGHTNTYLLDGIGGAKTQKYLRFLAQHFGGMEPLLNALGYGDLVALRRRQHEIEKTRAIVADNDGEDNP